MGCIIMVGSIFPGWRCHRRKRMFFLFLCVCFCHSTTVECLKIWIIIFFLHCTIYSLPVHMYRWCMYSFLSLNPYCCLVYYIVILPLVTITPQNTTYSTISIFNSKTFYCHSKHIHNSYIKVRKWQWGILKHSLLVPRVFSCIYLIPSEMYRDDGRYHPAVCILINNPLRARDPKLTPVTLINKQTRYFDIIVSYGISDGFTISLYYDIVQKVPVVS